MIDPFNPEAINGRPRPVVEREGVVADALYFLRQAIPKKEKQQLIMVDLGSSQQMIVQESSVKPVEAREQLASVDLSIEEAQALVREAQGGN